MYPQMLKYGDLPSETQAAVDKVIAEVRSTGGRVSHPHKTGDVYAYPHAEDEIAWGVNGGERGFNIARDTVKR